MDYRWVDGKDPIIGILQTLIQQTYGECSHSTLDRLSYDSGVSIGALRAWFFGETKRPLHASVRMVMSALDVRVKIVRNDGTEVRQGNHNYEKDNAKQTTQKGTGTKTTRAQSSAVNGSAR